MLKWVPNYTWTAVNIPGWPVQVKSMFGKHWVTFVICIAIWLLNDTYQDMRLWSRHTAHGSISLYLTRDCTTE